MKRNFVFNLSQHGFLLIEHLIATIITGSLILLTLSFIQVTKSYTSNLTVVSQNQIDILATQLQIESKTASYFKLSSPSELGIVLQTGTHISYRIQNQKLIRQVDGKGGEVALYHCDGLQAHLINEKAVELQLQTSTQNFKFYLTTLTLPLPSILAIDSEEDLDFEKDTPGHSEDIFSEQENTIAIESEEEVLESIDFPLPDDNFDQEVNTDLPVIDDLSSPPLLDDLDKEVIPIDPE